MKIVFCCFSFFHFIILLLCFSFVFQIIFLEDVNSLKVSSQRQENESFDSFVSILEKKIPCDWKYCGIVNHPEWKSSKHLIVNASSLEAIAILEKEKKTLVAGDFLEWVMIEGHCAIRYVDINGQEIILDEADPKTFFSITEIENFDFYGKDIFLENKNAQIEFVVRYRGNPSYQNYSLPLTLRLESHTNQPLVLVIDEGSNEFLEGFIFNSQGIRYPFKKQRKLFFHSSIPEISCIKLEKNEFQINFEGRKILCKEQDWLLIQSQNVIILDSLEYLEKFLRRDLEGDLIIFEGISEDNLKIILSLYDSSRTIYQKIEVNIYAKEHYEGDFNRF